MDWRGRAGAEHSGAWVWRVGPVGFGGGAVRVRRVGPGRCAARVGFLASSPCRPPVPNRFLFSGRIDLINSKYRQT